MLQYNTEVEIGTILQLGNYTFTVIEIDNEEVHFRVEHSEGELNSECDGSEFSYLPK